jgi:alpha-beta hydrolase superfamily lysophospholipase
MTKVFWVAIAGVILALSISVVPQTPAFAAESTMPEQYQEQIKPELAAKYVYTENGDYTKALNVPTYEWMPVGVTPRAMVLGIHGMTLHGRRFRVIARTLAVNGLGFVSLDMRGFGACYFGDAQRFCTPDDDRRKINNQKSYEDIVQLALLIKKKYPDVRLIALGESLGCTFCVRLAAEHPELIYGIALSAPAVRLNHDMYLGKGQIGQGIKAIVKTDHEVNMKGFFADLCSRRLIVQNEMLDDPYIRKEMPLGALLSTDEFVEKTAHWGKRTDPSLSVFILQGSHDGCVSPKHVVDLLNAMKSDDQTLDWRGNYGHLQLETIYMRAPVIDAVSNWFNNHSLARLDRLKQIEKQIAELGGSISQ